MVDGCKTSSVYGELIYVFRLRSVAKLSWFGIGFSNNGANFRRCHNFDSCFYVKHGGGALPGNVTNRHFGAWSEKVCSRCLPLTVQNRLETDLNQSSESARVEVLKQIYDNQNFVVQIIKKKELQF